MRVQFDTESVASYEFANGRKPRGEGAWMFDVVWGDGNGSYTSETVTTHGTFAQAKAEAMRYARHEKPGAAREAMVSVCP